MNKPNFTLDKIKFATHGPTFEKAVALYESDKVVQVEEGVRSYTAVVMGTKPYRVSVEARRCDYGHCTCYLGANGTLCKHMVALAIYVVQDGKLLTDNDKKQVQNPTCSGKLGILSNDELTVSTQTADLLVDLLLRLDKKLCTAGVDDSDGEVGGFIEGVVSVLQEFAKLDPSCVNAFDKLENRETCL